MGFSSTAIFYVLIGGYFGLNRIQITSFCSRYRYVAVLVFAVLLPLGLIFNQDPIGGYITNAYIPFGLICIFNLSSWVFLNFPRLSAFCYTLLPAIFFVYALHTVYLVNWVVAGLAKLGLTSGALGLVGYLLAPLVIVAVCWALYLLMSKFAPKVLSLLTGGRS